MNEVKKTRKSSSSKKTRKTKHQYILKDFLIDCSKANMYYGAIVRTKEEKGKITNIEAENLPEGYFLYTARDIPGKNSIKTLDVETEIFCKNKVHYKGEPVGILVGTDIKMVRQLASEVQITIVDDSTEKESTDSEKVLATRIVKTGFFKEEHTDEEIDEFFKNEKFEICDNWDFSEILSEWVETSGAFCYSEGSSVTVLASTQWPSHIQKNVASALGIDETRVEVRKTLSQTKNNNGSWRTTVLAVQASIAAYLCGHPIKLLLRRKEQEKFMKGGISLSVSQRTCVNSDGKIKAMQILVNGDVGYINPFSKEIANRLSIAVVNLYSPENLSISTVIKSSRQPPTSMALETVDSGAFFAVENHIHHIADEIGLLPDEIRLLNIGDENANFKYKNLKYKEALNAIITKSDFHRKYATFKMNSIKNARGDQNLFRGLSLRGVGLSCATEGSYFLGSRLDSSSQKIEMTLELDGTVTVNTSAYSGTIYEIWKKIISNTLQIDPIMINFSSGFETGNEIAEPLPDGLVSNVSLMTMLLKKCCAEIQKKRFHAPLPITVKKTPSSSMGRAWSKENFCGTPFYTASFGSAIVEVEINPDTYSHKITGIWVAIDCGEILSLRVAENTIRLSIAQELEHLASDMKMFCPEIKIFFVQSSNPPGQINSIIHNIIPAAYTSALSQATSKIVNSLPCSCQTLFELTELARDEKKQALQEKIDVKKTPVPNNDDKDNDENDDDEQNQEEVL